MPGGSLWGEMRPISGPLQVIDMDEGVFPIVLWDTPPFTGYGQFCGVRQYSMDNAPRCSYRRLLLPRANSCTFECEAAYPPRPPRQLWHIRRGVANREKASPFSSRWRHGGVSLAKAGKGGGRGGKTFTGECMETEDQQALGDFTGAEELATAEQPMVALVDILFEQAMTAYREHRDFVMQHDDKEPDWSQRSIMTPRVRKRGGSVTIEWAWVEWKGLKAKGTRKLFMHTISKGRDSFAYSNNVLFKHARDWEKGMVEITEARMAAIRRRLKSVQRAL